MAIKIEYYYDEVFSRHPDWIVGHDKICTMLQSLKESSRIVDLEIREHKEAFPTQGDKQVLFDRLSDFSLRHHVALARVFGSNKHGFCYLPPRFLLVFENNDLKEVFPYRVREGEVDLLSSLESFAKGEPWTLRTAFPEGNGKHKQLLDRIGSNPSILEPGLKLEGRNTHVSLDFGEIGYIDLVFKDQNSSYLLVEVKVKPEEIDKAIGQVLRHKYFFVSQNFLVADKVRVAIACPYIPASSRKICEGVGISCFEIPT